MINFLLCSAAIANAIASDDGNQNWGHSKHGSAFDSGLRTKPWPMTGIGSSSFPITCRNPEVQEWFNQGTALLHSFWFEEAERTFRWCVALEPNNAMAYFGLAQCGMNWFSIDGGGNERSKLFLKEASLRKMFVTERERMYIEAWEVGFSGKEGGGRRALIRALQDLSIKFPDDLEAKVHLAFYNIGQGSALANEALIQQVLRVVPKHPGAHHARIHNWDSINGSIAVQSCEQYGKVAPNIGHSRHMPGHIYSKIGMWHEAAIAMDSATRVELRYMKERLALPYETWNYAHNRDYLSYIQEQLGMFKASYHGSLDLWNAPTDPENTSVESREWMLAPMIRALVKFEKWDVILDGKTIPQVKSEFATAALKCVEALALVSTKKLDAAREKVKEARESVKKTGSEDRVPIVLIAAEAKLKVLEGDRPAGLKMLTDAVQKETKERNADSYANDPPFEPWPIVRILGDFYFEGGDYLLAVQSYQTALDLEPNDGWALRGLALAHQSLGQTELAKLYASRVLAVWSHADDDFVYASDIRRLFPSVKASPVTYRPERVYRPESLDRIGPSNWTPFEAPKLNCKTVEGEAVSIKNWRGKNLVIVFYLSDECVHCVEQLVAIDKRITEFRNLNTEVVAICSQTSESLKDSTKLAPLNLTLLSDSNHENARRFASYDDFERMELHSTILVDAQGRVRWKRTGGKPFMDVDFLIRELQRVNSQELASNQRQ